MGRRLTLEEFRQKNEKKYKAINKKSVRTRTIKEFELSNRYERDDSTLKPWQEAVSSRSISSSAAEKIATNNPSYVFSSIASLTSFKSLADKISESAISNIKNSKLLDDMKHVLDEIQNIESKKALEFCKSYGKEANLSNARDLVLKIFQDGMNLVPSNMDTEAIILHIVKEELNNIDRSTLAKTDQSFLKNLESRQKNIGNKTEAIEEILQTLQDTDLVKSMRDGVETELAPIYFAYKNLKNTIGNENIVQLLKTGKGTLQELIDYTYLSKIFANSSIKLDLVGSINAKDTERIINSIASARKGSSAAGITKQGIETDLFAYYDVDKKLGISIKSTVDVKDGKYLYRTSDNDYVYNIKDIANSLKDDSKYKEIYKAVQYGLVVLMSSFNMESSINPTYYARDKVLKPLAFSIINSEHFILNFFRKQQKDDNLKTIDILKDPDFHFILIINNKVFWYSDILKTTIEEVSNYNSDIYNKLLTLENFDSMSLMASKANSLYDRKRQLLRRKEIKKEKSYEKRLEYILKDSELLGMLKEYNEAAKSLSIRISTSNFRVKR